MSMSESHGISVRLREASSRYIGHCFINTAPPVEQGPNTANHNRKNNF